MYVKFSLMVVTTSASSRRSPPWCSLEDGAAGRKSFRVYTRSARRRGRWSVQACVIRTNSHRGTWPPWYPVRRLRHTVDSRRVHAAYRPPTPPYARLVREVCSLVGLRRRRHPRSPRTDRHHQPLPSPVGRSVPATTHPTSVTTGGSATPATHATAAAARASERLSVLSFATAHR